jgi:uncharacterized protein (DUF433 family)
MAISPAETVDLTKYVDENPAGGRPRVRGRRIPVATLAHAAVDQNWSVAELAIQYGLSEAQVAAALLYYQEHKATIEQREREYQQELDAAAAADHGQLLSR